MSRPRSYPFLSIAKRHGLDYSDVLMMADDLMRERCIEYVDPLLVPIFVEIAAATDEQEAIRNGVIDWQTGERIRGSLTDAEIEEFAEAWGLNGQTENAKRLA